MVECGTWRGGMAAGLATVGGTRAGLSLLRQLRRIAAGDGRGRRFAQEAQRAQSGALWHDNNRA